MSHVSNPSLHRKLPRARRICEDVMVHLVPSANSRTERMWIQSDAEETIARNSASQEDKPMIFCVLLLLNNGQLLNAWNPPDVDFLWLFFRSNLNLKMSLGTNSVPPFFT